MHIVVSGSTGLVGSALCAGLMNEGHRVTRLVRAGTGFKAPMGTYSEWDPTSGKIDAGVLRGVDAVVNLCGENVANGYWTTKKKKCILESRTRTTATLAEALAGLLDKPRVWLNASAVGYYGDRGDELLDEASPPGGGFFPEVCKRWEASAQPAIDAGVRTAFMRFGIILTPEGGALEKMLPLYRLGLGGKLGEGQQYWSWISMPDTIDGIMHLLTLEDAQGAYNFTAPEPLTNQQFSTTLGRVLKRPALFTVPEQFLSIATGDMAANALLTSQRVLPHRLIESGFEFSHNTLAEALNAVLD